MDTDTKTETDVVTETNEGEGEVDTLSIPKKDYETLNQTLGSLKRELKDLKKAKEEAREEKETPKNQPDENKLLEKLERMSLRQAGIDHPDDVELARKTADKWKVDIDEVLGDEDFKIKLGKQQDARANTVATSNVRGSAGNASQAKLTPEYWIAKGQPPLPSDIPDRKVRAKIHKAMMAEAKGTGKNPYYNG